MADSSQEYATVIGPDANFKGELEFESGAKVLGRFEGSITSKGKVFIADGADCKATITAREVSIEGKINGNVQANDRVELKPSGVVHGDIVAVRMTMAEGASINGNCRIGGAAKHEAGARPGATAEAKPTVSVTAKEHLANTASPAGKR